MFIIIDRVVEVWNTFLYGHLEKKSIVNLWQKQNWPVGVTVGMSVSKQLTQLLWMFAQSLALPIINVHFAL